MDTEDLVAQLRAAGCVFAEEEARLLQVTAVDDAHLRVLADRRIAGEPLEHVLGWAEFCGLRIQVDPGVFRPRPRTEFLVEHATGMVQPGSSPVVVVDLCCGSGALGVALTTVLRRVEPHAGDSDVRAGDTDRPAGDIALCAEDADLPRADVELHAADVDPVAVACARRNVERVGGRVHLGDLFAALPDGLCGRVDVLLANVPYVPTGDLGLMPAEARLHEPVGTLDGGRDGLDVLRRVAAEATRWLAPGGHLLTEVSARQAGAAAEVLSSAGLAASVVTSEEYDATVAVGTARN